MFAGVDTAVVKAGLPGYSVDGELDRGGYGITYDASIGGQRFAIKILDTHWHEAAIRTPREIAALRSVNHPNVVRLLDEGFLDTPATPGRYRYLACQYVPGANLGVLAAGGHRFTVDETLSIGRQCAAGLQAIHDAQLIHRDVKPSNVMFNATTGAVVLLDLGIAKHLDASPVTVGAAPGTLGWKAPEHIRQETLDRRSDLYELGLVLYWLASGKHPFEAQKASHGGDLEAAMLAGRFDSASAAQPALPAGVADAIDQMLALQPYDRPRRARDVIGELR
jgi:serine/threonine protein kinase